MNRKEIPFSPPDISNQEIDLVVDALKSGWITTGPKTKKFEKDLADYIGSSKVVCLNSATAAMELTLRILGVGPGDEVITSAYTYTASASVIHHVGAKIVLVDTAKDSFEMDYDLLEKAITDKTKAIIPVDIAGKMCDYQKIMEIVTRKKNIFKPKTKLQVELGRISVLADSAHAFGATYLEKKSGLIADFTCFSFHAVKNLTTSEGGAVTWNPTLNLDDDYIYNEYMLLSLHGQSKDALSKNKPGSWEYDIIYPGYKCNMTDLTAAIGIAQLTRYPSLLKRRKKIIELYDKYFEGTKIESLKHFDSTNQSSGHLYMCRIKGFDEEKRNQLIESLGEIGIATNVHYKPLPMLTAYKNLGFDIIDFPNAYQMYTNGITFPLHTLLTDEDVEYICKNVLFLIGGN